MPYLDCWCPFPVCCLRQDVEFDWIGSWSLPFYLLRGRSPLTAPKSRTVKRESNWTYGPTKRPTPSSLYEVNPFLDRTELMLKIITKSHSYQSFCCFFLLLLFLFVCFLFCFVFVFVFLLFFFVVFFVVVFFGVCFQSKKTERQSYRQKQLSKTTLNWMFFQSVGQFFSYRRSEI